MGIQRTAKDYYDSCKIAYYRDCNKNEYITLIGWLNLVELQENIIIKDKMNVEKLLAEALESKSISGEDLARTPSKEILTRLGAEWLEDSARD